MSDKSFENCPKKRAVQGKIYGIIYEVCKKKKKPNAVILPGPSIKRSIELAGKFSNKIYCLENDRYIYDETRSQYNELPGYLQRKVKSACGNIVDYKNIFRLENPCRVMDVDLCRTLWATSHIIAACLRDQASNKSKSYKYFMLTVSLRRKGWLKEALYELDRIVLKEIGVKINVEFSVKEENRSNWTWTQGSTKKHAFYTLKIETLDCGRLVRNGLQLYTYKDTSEMLTCFIVYK